MAGAIREPNTDRPGQSALCYKQTKKQQHRGLVSQKGGSIQPVAIEAVTELTDEQEYRAGESNTGEVQGPSHPKHVSLERKGSASSPVM